MPHSVEYTVRSAAFEDAPGTVRSALLGRGFIVSNQSSKGFVATRGSRSLTAVLGGLVPPGKHYVHLHIDGLHRPFATSVITLHPRPLGTSGSGSGGLIGARRHAHLVQWAADGIERSLAATGVLVGRVDGRLSE